MRSFTHERAAGPALNHVGNEQIAGLLRNSGGRTVGQFAFTCTWIRILAGGDALERCAGSGRTRDGRLDVAGRGRESEVTSSWRITASSGAYRGAHGTVLLRDISDGETLITATVAPRTGAVLHVAVISRPATILSLIAQADQICTRASRQLASLPPFPFSNFDPLRPDRAAAPGRSVLHRPGRSPPDAPDPRFAPASARRAPGKPWLVETNAARPSGRARRHKLAGHGCTQRQHTRVRQERPRERQGVPAGRDHRNPIRSDPMRSMIHEPRKGDVMTMLKQLGPIPDEPISG
jgi:hypothetical protein